jgi:hypothetical protein
MSKVLVTETHLEDIADAIREKLGVATTYRPGDMAAAIESISGGYPEPTGTINITQNGTVNVKDYASANVNVPGGGVTRKTKSEWDALSFSEKKALGLTVVGELTDIRGRWYDYSSLTYEIDIISAVGDGAVDTKTINISDYYNYERLAVFVAVNDNNTGVIEINDVQQTVTRSGDIYFCATLINSAASFTVKIGHGDGGSAMYSVAVYGINGLTSATNHAVYVSGSSATISIPNAHRAAIVDVMTDRVSGVCAFDGTDMTSTQIGRGYFGNLYHAYLVVNAISAGEKQLSGPSGVKCFQILALD